METQGQQINANQLLDLKEFLLLTVGQSEQASQTIDNAESIDAATWVKLRGKRTIRAWLYVLENCYEIEGRTPPQSLRSIRARIVT